MRIEVGYGLEGVLTDGKCGAILDSYVVPYYEQKNYEKAIEQGFTAIYNELGKYYANPTEYNKKAEIDTFAGMVMFWVIVGFLVILVIIGVCTGGGSGGSGGGYYGGGSSGSGSSWGGSSGSSFGGGGGFGGGGAGR